MESRRRLRRSVEGLVTRGLGSTVSDEHLVEEDRNEGLLLGDRPVPINPEAESVQDDIDHELYGTTDVGHAIADGTAWIPPTSPTQEGIEGEEDNPIDDADRDSY